MSEQIRHNSTDFAENLEQQLADLTALALKTLREVMEDVKASASVRLKAALAVLNRRKPTVQPRVPPQKSVDNLLHQFLNMGMGSVIPQPATPRNALCPCGSGLKHKRCCGTTAAPHLSQMATAVA